MTGGKCVNNITFVNSRLKLPYKFTGKDKMLQANWDESREENLT